MRAVAGLCRELRASAIRESTLLDSRSAVESTLSEATLGLVTLGERLLSRSWKVRRAGSPPVGASVGDESATGGGAPPVASCLLMLLWYSRRILSECPGTSTARGVVLPRGVGGLLALSCASLLRSRAGTTDAMSQIVRNHKHLRNPNGKWRKMLQLQGK